MKQTLTRRVAGMSRKAKVVLVAGTATVSVAAAGGVIALWSANASGNGEARAVTAQTVTVTAATGTADLYPGYTGGKVYFTLTNNNPYGVTFTAMTPGTVTSSNQANCPASNVTAASKTGLTLNVGANTTSSTLNIDAVATMASSAPDGCQGVTFTIPLTLTGSQTP